MTADANGLPKYARVARTVRGQVADGTLRPGQPAPSGAALSRVTGYSTLTCRRALRLLIAEGVLTPGPSPNARPRVAGGVQPPGQRDLSSAGRVLSATLAARRRAQGMTQPDLAGRAGVSVTTVGHAETGRLWQSRWFWEQADAALDAGGELLALHDAFRAAASASQEAQAVQEGQAHQQGQAYEQTQPDESEPPPAGGLPPVRDGPGPVGPASVTIVWGNGTTTTIRPPQPPSSP